MTAFIVGQYESWNKVFFVILLHNVFSATFSRLTWVLPSEVTYFLNSKRILELLL